jgi:L-ascorbate metabolism protein UlaG (beta-lactamase superfamily)
MRIKYFGHAAFLIENLLIDPFIKGNPLAKVNTDEIRCDIICVTHDHRDHLGDTAEIAKLNKATVVGVPEVVNPLNSQGINTESMNIGGEIEVGEWKVKMVNALHSGSGHSTGFVLKNIKFKKNIYHAGDTGVFSDMKLIGEEEIDIALLPIGGRYTMGVEDALKALELIKPKIAIPMHYNTFPIIEADPSIFKEKASCEVVILKPGEEIDISRKLG